MTAIEHQQRTAKLLLGWWFLTNKEYFLDYAMKTIALFDAKGGRGVFEAQCRRLRQRMVVAALINPIASGSTGK